MRGSKPFLCIVFFAIVANACKKNPFNPSEGRCDSKPDQVCENAMFTLINRTQDSVFFGIGTNYYEDTLLPGESFTRQYGDVDVTYDANCVQNRKSFATHQLHSNWGEWAYHIDHCNKKSAFEYTDATRQQIRLYDVTWE